MDYSSYSYKKASLLGQSTSYPGKYNHPRRASQDYYVKKRFNILVLMHDFLVPKKRNSTRGRLNRDKTPWITEYDVLKALKDLGHRAFPFGLSDDLNKLDEAIHEINPNLIFNMVETFRGDRLYEPHLASFLELKGIPQGTP